MENEKIEYYGGYFEIYEDHLTIYEKVLAMFKIKYNQKEIPFTQIKEINCTKKGFTHIGLAGISIDTGAVNNCINRLPNEITFKTDEEMEQAYNKINIAFKKYLDNNNLKTNNNGISTADEIKKYKELLDSGIITQEVFDMKKKNLLNL